MTDNDICGAECVDGSECQHPAGSCPVPSHHTDGADNPQGRDFVLGEDDHGEILDAARSGLSKAGCARAAGVEKPSLLRYLDQHPGFRTAFRRARAEGEQRLIEGALFRDQDAREQMDGQHARFLLSTSFDYQKSEKREVEHSGQIDGDRRVELDAETAAAIREATLDE